MPKMRSRHRFGPGGTRRQIDEQGESRSRQAERQEGRVAEGQAAQEGAQVWNEEETMKREKANYTVTLKSAGNPDHGQFLNSGILSPTIQKHCSSIDECRQAVREYTAEYELGTGNWIGGEVRQNGQVVGRISYNGRFWTAEPTGGAGGTRPKGAR